MFWVIITEDFNIFKGMGEVFRFNFRYAIKYDTIKSRT